jgi:hypothetical protein
MKRAVAVLLALAAGQGVCRGLDPVQMDFLFAPHAHKAQGFPDHCLSYAVFRGAGKVRPLYLCGKMDSGTLTFRFDSVGRILDCSVEGHAGVVFSPSCTILSDVKTHACATWLEQKPAPAIAVKLKAVRDLHVDDSAVSAFLRQAIPHAEAHAAAKALAKAKKEFDPIPPVRLATRAFADVEISVGAASATAAGVPVDVAFVQDGIWSAEFVAVCKVKGRALGLTGEDAGDLSVYLHLGAFCRVPDNFAPEREADKKTEKLLKSLDVDALGVGD